VIDRLAASQDAAGVVVDGCDIPLEVDAEEAKAPAISVRMGDETVHYRVDGDRWKRVPTGPMWGGFEMVLW
jgi:hypothetical protein